MSKKIVHRIYNTFPSFSITNIAASSRFSSNKTLQFNPHFVRQQKKTSNVVDLYSKHDAFLSPFDIMIWYHITPVSFALTWSLSICLHKAHFHNVRLRWNPGGNMLQNCLKKVENFWNEFNNNVASFSILNQGDVCVTINVYYFKCRKFRMIPRMEIIDFRCQRTGNTWYKNRNVHFEKKYI